MLFRIWGQIRRRFLTGSVAFLGFGVLALEVSKRHV